MGGKGGAPAPPDYSALAASSAHAADVQAQTSADQLAWAKQQYSDIAPFTKSYLTSMTDASNQNIQNAQQAQNYYKSTYQPIESQFAQEATGWNTPARAAERSAAAQTDVANTFAGQRNAALQGLESYGIDPSQTRYGALDLGTRISQAAAQAAAGTTSRQQSEAQGLALQGEAINVGRGYPGQIAQSYNTATSTGQSGINAGLNTSSTYGSLMGTPTQWAGLQNQNLSTSANIMNQGFQNQLAAFNSNAAIAQNQAGGIGSLAGAAIVAGGIAI